jgi:NNP family nitrate/nitrite transporter-like MFS transporter
MGKNAFSDSLLRHYKEYHRVFYSSREEQIGGDDDLYECPMPESFRDKIGITVFLAWLFYLGFVSRVLFAPLMPEIEKDLGINHGQAGTMFLLMSLGYVLAPVCSGLISSRIYHLGALKVSAWLVGCALILFSFVENLLGIGFLLIVVGFAGSIHLPSAIATITAEIQKSDWGKGLSVHQLAPPLSFVSAPLIAALLLRWFSWREILLFWGVISLFSALLYSFFGKGGAFPGRVLNVKNVKVVISTRSFWVMLILFSMAMSANAGIFAMLPLYFVEERGFDLTLANTLIGVSQLSGVVMLFFAGRLTDKIGEKKMMAFSLLAAALLTILLSCTKGWLLILVLFIQPAVLTAFFPAGFAALSRIAAPSMRSVVNALGPPVAFLIGGGLMPAMIGYMAETFSFSGGILTAGCFVLLGPALVFFVRLGEYDDQGGC